MIWRSTVLNPEAVNKPGFYIDLFNLKITSRVTKKLCMTCMNYAFLGKHFDKQIIHVHSMNGAFCFVVFFGFTLGTKSVLA